MLLSNIHLGLLPPEVCDQSVAHGVYYYYHYSIDGVDDKGWGCGYRSLQTIVSWFVKTYPLKFNDIKVPSINDIQQVLVTKALDKAPTFIGSKDWIGSYEIFLVLDILLQVPCKLLHVRKGEDLIDNVCELSKHFKDGGSPIMMGGDIDCSSKCILGITSSDNRKKTYLLVLDPHFERNDDLLYSKETLQNEGFVRWTALEEFDQQSFYNFCIPIFNPEKET